MHLLNSNRDNRCEYQSSPKDLPESRQVPEHNHLESEGDKDVEGVLHEADHVSLLKLEGDDVNNLLGKAKEGQTKDTKTLSSITWKTKELEVGTDDHQLQDVEDLGGDG